MDRQEKIRRINEWFNSHRCKYFTGSEIGCSYIQAFGSIDGTGYRMLKTDGTSVSIYEAPDNVLDAVISKMN